ncbi:uncharacterized protein LOC114800969 [Denticeps clupeoides]|uniref:uncharacterized protein LOC114800969 n=1 Tax=Denticeps clupeoides TaxID=299321 RepID=UPI0010A346D2|nr:uncharacterized protein LOC114800969 [Denticeps clupeoides]
MDDCLLLMMVMIFISVNTTKLGEQTTPLPYMKKAITRRVNAGDTVILHCDEEHRKKTDWYGHSDQAALFKITASKTSDNQDKIFFIWGYTPEITATWNPNNQSFSLTIKNMTVPTQGFYYCTTGEGVLTVTGTLHILVIHDKVEVTTTGSTLMITDRSQTTSALVPVCWTLTPILCSACTALTALGCCLHHRKKNNRTNQGKTHETHQGDDNQDEDGTLQYSTLHFSKQQRRSKKKNVNQSNEDAILYSSLPFHTTMSNSNKS